MVHVEKDYVSCLAENVKFDSHLIVSIKGLDPEYPRVRPLREVYILSMPVIPLLILELNKPEHPLNCRL